MFHWYKELPKITLAVDAIQFMFKPIYNMTYDITNHSGTLRQEENYVFWEN